MAFDVARAGHGRRLLLLHSGFCTWVEYRRLIDLLAPDFEVIAPTLPGSAGGPPIDVRRSMLAEHADYVEQLLDDAGWDDTTTVVGSSFGGVAALELLARGRVARSMALAPPWTSGAGLPFYGALFGGGISILGLTRPLWPRTTRSGVINGLWFHGSPIAPQIEPEDVAAILDSATRFPLFRVGLHARGRGPGMPDLGRIDPATATLVWGDRDLMVPSWMRRRWRDALPAAHHLDLPGFPHQPHLRDPAVVAGLIRNL